MRARSTTRPGSSPTRRPKRRSSITATPGLVVDRAAGGTLTKLFSARPALDGQPLVPQWPQEITSRDGKTLVSYLTLPKSADTNNDGKAEVAVPLVLVVHGGPWARDSYGYSPYAQWLANRGYASLAVNFRGSTGFGKTFTNAGNGEWAGKMHDDLLDAKQWAVGQASPPPTRSRSWAPATAVTPRSRA
jgi:dipeptidyl aminopeptidase/acylaminoacyl peptidase